MSQPRAVSQLSTNEFMARAVTNGRSELVRGQIRVVPAASGAQARVSGNVSRLLGEYVTENALGRCFEDTTGYELPNVPDTVRLPDASFVRADRLPLGGNGGGWLGISPDIAVEVLTPTITKAELDEKLADYRAADTPLVWVIDPERRRISVISHGAAARQLEERDTLDGADVVPGFSVPVSRVFEGIAQASL